MHLNEQTKSRLTRICVTVTASSQVRRSAVDVLPPAALVRGGEDVYEARARVRIDRNEAAERRRPDCDIDRHELKRLSSDAGDRRAAS